MAIVTVNQLYRKLGKLIEKGHGRLPVCVSKTTFQHNCEGDGCTILPVDGVHVLHINMDDGDGGTALTKSGREITRRTAVIVGGSYEPSSH